MRPRQKPGQADQKADESDDRQRSRAAILDRQHQIGAPEPRPADEYAANTDYHFAEEADEVAGHCKEAEAAAADPGKQVRPLLCSPGPLALRTARARARRRWTPPGRPARSTAATRSPAIASSLPIKLIRMLSQPSSSRASKETLSEACFCSVDRTIR